MRRNHTERKKGLLATSLMGAASIMVVAAMAPAAIAQSAGQSAAEDEIEEIVVTGFRQSIRDALDEKRAAQNIIDGISAEDIGKSADQNIAEALQRITGVSINSEDGVGTTVSVRGVGADLNVVTLNGQVVTSGGGDIQDGGGNQGVDFSNFSADILSRIEVAKTPSADHDEGSLGASINLRTFKPLSVRKDRRVLDVQARYSPFESRKSIPTLGDVTDNYRINLSLSEKLFNDTIGVSLVGISEKNSIRQDIDEVTRYFPLAAGGPPPANFGVDLPGGFTNIDTGEIIQEFDYGTGGGGVRNVVAHAPFEKQYQYQSNETLRDSLSATVQWRPDDTLDVQLDATYTETDRNQDQWQYRVRPNGGNRNGEFNLFSPETNDLVGFRRTAAFSGRRGSGDTNPGFIRPATNRRDTTDKNTILSLGVEKEWNDFTFNLRAGQSTTTSVDDDVFNITYQIENQPDNNGSRPGSFNGFLRDRTNPSGTGGAGIVQDGDHAGFYSGYTCAGNSFSGVCPIVVSAQDVAAYNQSQGPVAANPDAFSFGSISNRDRNIDDKNQSVFFDVDWDKSFGPVTSLETGFKFAKRERDQQQTNRGFSRFSAESNALFGILLSEFTSGERTPSDFGEALGLPRDAITSGVALADADLLLARLESEEGVVPRTRPSPAGQRVFNLDIFSVYAKANFNMLDGRLFGDVGVRYSETETASKQGGDINLLENNFTTAAENVDFFGSQEAAEAALGIDLVNDQDPAFMDVASVSISADNKYTDVLPSLNVNYLFREDVMLRFAASKTIARPPFDDLRPGFNFQENAFNTSTSLRLGNPFLNPFESTNLDVSAEWYFNEDSLFSVALFNKDLGQFSRGVSSTSFFVDARSFLYDGNGVALPADQVVTPPLQELILPFSNNQPANCLPNREFDYNSLVGAAGCELVNVDALENGSGGFVRGAEVSFQTNFTQLPGLLANTGVIANYTYADSQTDENVVLNDAGDQVVAFSRAAPFANTSLHTFNLTGFYEGNGKQFRLAYNSRSDYLQNGALRDGYARYAEGRETLDMSGGIDLGENLRLNFSASNLLDTVFRTYAVVNDGQFERTDPRFANYSQANPLPREELTLGSQPTHRTLRRSNTGRIYRVGLRYEF